MLVKLGHVQTKEFSFSATGCVFRSLTEFVIVRALECTNVFTESSALVGYFSGLLCNDSELLGRGWPIWLNIINSRCRAIKKFGASSA